MSSFTLSNIIPLLIYATVVPAVLGVAILAITYIFTTLRYQRSIWQTRSHDGKPITPLKIPYTIPFIGNAIAFLNQKPGGFWTYLFAWHPRSTGACTLKMGGRYMHVLYDPHAIQAVMKARDLNRQGVTLEVISKGFGLDLSEATQYFGWQEPALDEFGGRTPLGQQEHINNETLIRSDRIVELLTKFTENITDQFSSDFQQDGEPRELNLYEWIRKEVFKASTITFFGDTLLQDYPNLEDDFYDFDANFHTCYFGIPRWIAPKAYEVRERITQGMTRWHERNLERTKGTIPNPDGDVAWDKKQGSRANRARQIYYNDRGITTKSKAILDIGFLFGASSNAVPAIGWMLMHILDPRADGTIYRRVMDETTASRNPDGTIDIPTLANQPLLQSMYHEVLRMYVDTLVAREPTKDLIVPIGTGDDKLLLAANSIITLPSWIEHRDDKLWTNPDASTFHAERFLTTDPADGKSVFSMVGSAGKFFPFGGGKTICPGRLFAKQEVLVTIALVLTRFDVELLGFVDQKGRPTQCFPVPTDAYPGTAVLVMKGDARLRVSPKQ